MCIHLPNFTYLQITKKEVSSSNGLKKIWESWRLVVKCFMSDKSKDENLLPLFMQIIKHILHGPQEEQEEGKHFEKSCHQINSKIEDDQKH